jgi:ribosome-binding protein aMBF1 (putative translation factor)
LRIHTSAAGLEMITGVQIRKARELLGWAPSRLAQRAKLHSAIVQRAESVDGEPPITVYQHALIRETLERYGIEFAGSHECDVKMRQVGKAENDDR